MDLDITKNFTSPFVANKKRIFFWKKNNAYNLKFIDGNLLIKKNRKVDKKTDSLLVANQ